MKGERNNLFLLIFVGISIFSLIFMGFVSSFRIVKKEYNLSLREEDHIWGDPKKAKVIVYEYSRQDEWKNSQNPKELFIKYAQELNLDLKKFEEDYESQEIKNKILEERKEALSLGLTGTPSFFVNNRFVNLTSFDSLEKEIEKEIENK
jgi:hypothetical protein